MALLSKLAGKQRLNGAEVGEVDVAVFGDVGAFARGSEAPVGAEQAGGGKLEVGPLCAAALSRTSGDGITVTACTEGPGQRLRHPQWLLCVCTVLLAGAGTVAHGASRTTAPFRTCSFEESRYIGSVVLSDDGTRAFVVLFPRGVNVWAVVVYYWPELLGAVGVLGSLGAALHVWRILRRPQVVGKRCCPKCGYCVEHGLSDRCSECGYVRAIPRAVVGRSAWRRALPVVLPVVLYWCGYAVPLALRLPRTGPVTDMLDWWSVGLASWAKGSDWRGVTGQTRSICQIAELDVDSGSVTRRLLAGPDYRCNAQSIAPSDAALFVDSTCRELLVVSLRSGRVSRRLPYGDGLPPAPSGGIQLPVTRLEGFSSDAHTAYYVWFDEHNDRSQLMGWDLRTGHTRTIFEADATYHDLRGGASSSQRYLRRIPGPGERLLEMSAAPSAHYSVALRVRDLKQHGRILHSWSGITCYSEPVFDRNGRYMYIVEPTDETDAAAVSGSGRSRKYCSVRMSCWDLSTGQRGLVFEEALSVTANELSPLGYDAKRDYILVGANGEAPVILVGDRRLGTWTHRFECPKAQWIRRLAVSGDGEIMAAVVSRVIRGKSSSHCHDELLLFDLSVRDEADVAEIRDEGALRGSDRNPEP